MSTSSSRIVRSTIAERKWPIPKNLASQWRKDATEVLLSLVWQAYTALISANFFSDLDFEEEHFENLERSITQFLERAIRDCMNGNEPFYVQHEVTEEEGRFGGNARPKQYDIAFVWRYNPRFAWPLEAKVLRSDSNNTDLNEYVKEINSNFITCRYAPWSSEAAMVGYLLQGTTTAAFDNIASKLNCTLESHSEFAALEHRTSDHPREVPVDKQYPTPFRCHHLMMSISQI